MKEYSGPTTDREARWTASTTRLEWRATACCTGQQALVSQLKCLAGLSAVPSRNADPQANAYTSMHSAPRRYGLREMLQGEHFR